MPPTRIRLRGARQNNLKGFDLDLPLGELIVITGVSGAGKSSLAFDTLYAEGQRRYVETFSPYARQFLERMDKPRVDAIEGIPPAIAIDQVNPVRTSRSTVGTMTELNDHLKLLYARATRLHCRGCGQAVVRDTPQSVAADLLARARALGAERVLVTFPLALPQAMSAAEVTELLAQQGYTRVHRESAERLDVVQDRVRLADENRDRLAEAVEQAFAHGRGRVDIWPLVGKEAAQRPWPYSADLHCPVCDIHYREPTPGLFSFNSPLGACETCRGFGRVMGIDPGLVVPDEGKTLAEGALRTFQTASYAEVQDDLMRYARRRKIRTDVPWRELTEDERRWVWEGEGDFESGRWYGVQRFFDWLESKSYKMHIRVLLSKYRAYTLCPACEGARLKPEALHWRLGQHAEALEALPPAERHQPADAAYPRAVLEELPGLGIYDLMRLPLARAARFFERLALPAPLDAASEMLLKEIRGRLAYLCEVGLGYLTLDRQSRTLSGGEVQRINLTTALGTSLVNTLFVLDEPSIGLHARDLKRVLGVLQRLKAAGNTLVVVEHDAQLMRGADRIVDIGPGAGERGGHLLYSGTPGGLARRKDSVTGAYLSGRRAVGAGREARGPGTIALELTGAAAHNLKGVDVRIPLGRLVCVTGVSGSGKSTLVHEVLYRALAKAKGKPTEAPGAHAALAGHEHIADVVLVDQSAIGRTTRSNPASYVGALDPIRKLFALEPLARERGYTAGTFSFNAGNGRCPTCGGCGFEHVEMQFLSDVYLPCPDCGGTRYRAEVLDVKLAPPGTREAPRSVAEVLELTVDDACAFFAAVPEVQRVLEPLRAVGLGYVRLGQPVPTLSGGEAQRLKLAAHLGKADKTDQGLLFILDEPTSGLHFEDIATLLGAFDRLIDAGHSLLVVEHNLDVIAASDWLIDLGPEAGDAGGAVVAVGTPAAVARSDTHTGRALRERAEAPTGVREAVTRARPALPPAAICIRNAREHNLKGVDIDIPRGKLTAITGVSGSGKSTVAFDILFGEGQRRYLESLNAYARQFVQPSARPDVDAVHGIPPTVAIEQRTSRGGLRSTVATLTEIYHFLRLLFVKLGVPHCPGCDIPIAPQSPEAIAAGLLRARRGKTVTLLAPLVVGRKGIYKELAAWAHGRGFETLRVDGATLPTADWPRLDRHRTHDIALPVATLKLTPASEAELRAALDTALGYGKGTVQVLTEGAHGTNDTYSTTRACPGCGTGFPELEPRLFSFNTPRGWCPRCLGTGLAIKGVNPDTGEPELHESGSEEGDAHAPCPACHGTRLKPEALAVRFEGRSIAEYTRMPVREAAQAFGRLRLRGRAAAIAGDVVTELCERLSFLDQVGLDYLALERAAPTLSGGEAQRIRLAAQLGSNLQGVCYILDEPTIGLHPRDNRRLLDALAALRTRGNTVVVVEHDEDTIRRAEHIVDLGPGAGRRGGEVVAAGTLKQILKNPASPTGRMLAHPLAHPLVARRKVRRADPALVVRGADLNNLRGIDVRIPLGRLVCVTGVSGSGKSTLVRQVLHANLRKLLAPRRRKAVDLEGCQAIEGWEAVEQLLEVDQTPIGKTPRSCPATYVGIWDPIRRLLANTAEARLRGYTASRFSFNTKGGRCPVCEGQGTVRVEMNFLPDVVVPCDACAGARFEPQTLEVTWGGKSVAELLDLSVEEAVELFTAHPRIHRALALMQDVGLGYLRLGQPSPTLSGGEAQRLKLVTELARAREGVQAKGPHVLYVLDEPTIGLHMADVEKLIRVLHRLVEAGNSVLLIEHNLDVVAEADWIIDMGPEGGSGGGKVVAQGAPEVVAKRRTETAQALAAFLAGHHR
ncbi:excinuclease ABC subunit UvrA [Ectothiorhodospiraceae bacterium 2226]|nr:excinuclease ABC subunit UvrA [Ectothiorhodospiraceae bacterium 2226]